MAKKLLAEHEACLQSSNLERVAQFFPGAWVPPAQACQAPIAGARPVASQRSEG